MTTGGTWTYTLNNNNAAVQALNVGGTLTDTFTVHTADGTAQQVTVTINGANDAPTVLASGGTTAWTETSSVTGSIWAATRRVPMPRPRERPRGGDGRHDIHRTRSSQLP